MQQHNTMPDFKSAAQYWFKFGFKVIPVIPGAKLPAVKWDPWLDKLSTKAIIIHWHKHPDHEVGFIVGDDVIVFDADSPIAIAALAELEKLFDVEPLFTVTTAKGEHHYFRRATGTYAKSDSHNSEQYPDRIDVKTGRALVVLPPSTGKDIGVDEAEDYTELSEASQPFIDAVFIHNGRDAPRQAAKRAHSPIPLPDDLSQVVRQLSAMLDHIDPDVGYEDWLHVLMAVYHETDGSSEGLVLATAWSSRGSKYTGEDEIRQKWDSFVDHDAKPITVATLRRMLTDKGIDWIDVCAGAEPQFERSEFKTITVNGMDMAAAANTAYIQPTPIKFDQYSLTGRSAVMEAQALEQVYVLKPIALLGQWTVLYARHNTGKTLLVIYLLVEAIRTGIVNASCVYYFNLDDTHNGLLEKIRIAEEFGFNVLCDGHQDFKQAEFLAHIIELCDNEQATGIILILDTLKKFTDVMNKSKVSSWNKVMRRFVSKGGTLIALAHVNKNPGADGKSVYAGTSDSLDDADCGYVLDVVCTDDEAKIKVVEFENLKRRGNVVNRVSYSFSIEDALSYQELLASVTPVDELELVAVKQAEEIKSDSDIIDAVISCIQDGINTKMRLRDAVRGRIGCSRRAAIRVIEKYAGSDPTVHRWFYAVGERGAQVFSLLFQGESPNCPEESDNQAV